MKSPDLFPVEYGESGTRQGAWRSRHYRQENTGFWRKSGLYYRCKGCERPVEYGLGPAKGRYV